MNKVNEHTAGELKGYAPRFGSDCSALYVDEYSLQHTKKETTQYRLEYLNFLGLDGMLREYTILDIGCGTAGYYRLLRNFSKITGVDYSQRMLDAAQELAERHGYANKVDFVKASFDDFKTKETFDAIHVGVYGSYDPIDTLLLKRLTAMLNPGGVMMIGITPPKTWRQKLREFLNFGDVRISESRFERLVCQVAGLGVIWKNQRSSRTYYLLRVGEQSEIS